MIAGAGGAMRATGLRATPRSPSLSPSRAREVLMIAGAGGAMRATGLRATPRSPSLSPSRAREVLMIAGAGGAMRATGLRATAIRFQQFGEGGCGVHSLSDISGWRAGVLYPLAGGGRESGAAHFDLLGPPGWCSGCWPHDGDVAGGAGFLFRDIPVRGDAGAWAIGATDDAAAVQLRGLRQQPDRNRTDSGGLGMKVSVRAAIDLE